MAVKDEFKVISQIATRRLFCQLEVKDSGERADPVRGLLLEACHGFNIDLRLVMLVEEVEDAVAETAKGNFCEVVIPDYFPLAFQAVWR